MVWLEAEGQVDHLILVQGSVADKRMLSKEVRLTRRTMNRSLVCRCRT
jgi:hypothetical protein